MAKLRAKIAESSEEVELVGKKAKKRRAKAAARAAAARAEPKTPSKAVAAQPDDAMSRCAILCQEQRWRQAVLLCRRMGKKAKEDGREELATSLEGALKKIEYSLRRQMAAAAIIAVRDFLNKEYLLNV